MRFCLFLPPWSCYPEELERKPYDAKLRSQFYGLLSGYWSTLFGHRPCVMLNMMDEEVEVARQTRERTKSKDFLIMVSC